MTTSCRAAAGAGGRMSASFGYWCCWRRWLSRSRAGRLQPRRERAARRDNARAGEQTPGGTPSPAPRHRTRAGSACRCRRVPSAVSRPRQAPESSSTWRAARCCGGAVREAGAIASLTKVMTALLVVRTRGPRDGPHHQGRAQLPGLGSRATAQGTARDGGGAAARATAAVGQRRGNRAGGPRRRLARGVRRPHERESPDAGAPLLALRLAVGHSTTATSPAWRTWRHSRGS